MLGLVRPRVRAREAAALARLDSAALLNAVRPTRAWMRTAVLGGRADEPGASIPCLLCGCWWPCPLVRDKAFTRRACAACGYDGPELDVHYALGGVGSGGVCSCLRLAAARAAWFVRVRGLFVAHGFADAPVGPSGPRTRAAFARALGGRGRAGDAPLPRALALALPAAFVETLGAHAAREGAALDARLAAAP